MNPYEWENVTKIQEVKIKYINKKKYLACTNLRFCKPHQKQKRNFFGKSVVCTTPDLRALRNIPKSKGPEPSDVMGQKSFKNVLFPERISQNKAP